MTWKSQTLDFSAAWYVRGPHAQTIWGRLVRPRALVKLEREFIETPDGDELVLDHLWSDALQRVDGTHVLILHGLEGSSRSVYVQGVLSLLAKRGIGATVMNFRACVRPNRRPRLYHSGETTDFDFVANTMRARIPDTRLAAFGASLGGNALLKWLGEHAGQQLIAKAATLSVPYDLAAGASHIPPFYTWRFLRTLKQKANDVMARHREVRLDRDRIARSRTFVEYDDAATAPLHGFRGADDYYAESSSLHYLHRITTPTLCINAADDPFVPRESLDRAIAAASRSIEFVITRHGGHTGFIGGRVPWRPVYWAEELVVEWLTS